MTADPADGRRIDGGMGRGEPFEVVVDGAPLRAYRGETVAAVLFAAGRRRSRVSARLGQPRGLYCGMGVCWECVMVVDGRAGVRACTTLAAPGMRVETRQGPGEGA